MIRLLSNSVFWACLAVLLGGAQVRAASVRAEVLSRETQVGIPVVLQVVIENADADSAPRLPEIANVTVKSRGTPSEYRRVTVVNGVAESSVTKTYEFELTPLKPGQFTVPGLAVSVDGQTLRTRPITVSVTESQTGDLLFVEIKGDRDKLYVGERLRLTLQIWIRPYTDRQFGKLPDTAMWSCLDKQKSSWGEFLEPLQDILRQRRDLRGREVLRKDSEGVERSYYLYELSRTVQLHRPGQLTSDDINIVLTYPRRLGRSSDVFSMGRLVMTESMPISAQAKVQAIEVLPLPDAGRPAWFSGAVGQYSIHASAKPTEVAVGDPITLTLLINGTGDLQELQPPPLAELSDLNLEFRIPAEPLAGEVTADGKRFSVSIRAASDSVQQIPPIPFAFFDPVQEKYVTQYSQPIALQVKPAEKLAVSQIVDANGQYVAAPNRLTESTAGILANYTGMDEVLTHQDLAWGPWLWIALVLPPIGFAVSWTLQRRTDRLRNNTGLARSRRARRLAMGGLRSTKGESARQAAGVVAAVLGRYVADRCNLPSGGMTRSALVEQLQVRSVAADLVNQIDSLLEECEAIHYAGGGTRTGTELRELALDCIERLEREKLA